MPIAVASAALLAEILNIGILHLYGGAEATVAWPAMVGSSWPAAGGSTWQWLRGSLPAQQAAKPRL
jgi:hypothetical protein